MSQAVDALGKAATMLGVPPEALWAKIPGVTRDEVDAWREMAQANDSTAQFIRGALGLLNQPPVNGQQPAPNGQQPVAQ